jgi:hypothetical protein
VICLYNLILTQRKKNEPIEVIAIGLVFIDFGFVILIQNLLALRVMMISRQSTENVLSLKIMDPKI